MLGLKPWEFNRLTPGEFSDMMTGHRDRAETAEYLSALMTANLMNVHLERNSRVTPEKLLGREKKQQVKVQKTPKERKQELQEVRDRMGVW